MANKTTTVVVALVLAISATGAFAKGRKPVSPEAELAFGVKMAQRGLWAEALFRFQQAEKLGDTRTQLFNNMAVAYEALGVFDKAEVYYKKALDADPKNAPLRRNYSRFVEFYQSFQPDEDAEGESEAAATEESSSSAATGSS